MAFYAAGEAIRFGRAYGEIQDLRRFTEMETNPKRRKEVASQLVRALEEWGRNTPPEIRKGMDVNEYVIMEFLSSAKLI